MTENKRFKIINDCGDYHLMNGDEELCYDLCSPAMRKTNWNNVVDKLNKQEETIQNQKKIYHTIKTEIGRIWNTIRTKRLRLKR